jgi:hypothetical protein
MANPPVEGPAHHLERATPSIDGDQPNPVCSFDGPDVLDMGDNDISQPLAHRLDALDHETEIVKGGSERADIVLEGSEVLEPGKGNPHSRPRLGCA